MNCPACQRPLYNRRLEKCGYCSAPIPEELRFTKEEIEELDRKTAEVELNLRLREIERKIDRLSAQGGYIPPTIL